MSKANRNVTHGAAHREGSPTRASGMARPRRPHRDRDGRRGQAPGAPAAGRANGSQPGPEEQDRRLLSTREHQLLDRRSCSRWGRGAAAAQDWTSPDLLHKHSMGSSTRSRRVALTASALAIAWKGAATQRVGDPPCARSVMSRPPSEPSVVATESVRRGPDVSASAVHQVRGQLT
jgi:hypothetical protein